MSFLHVIKANPSIKILLIAVVLIHKLDLEATDVLGLLLHCFHAICHAAAQGQGQGQGQA
jgi:hypothetical protein